MSVAGLDPGAVGERPMPHLLAALLTPTRTTHSLAEALGRTNCLVVGAGQTPASCSLLKLTSHSLLPPWLSFALLSLSSLPLFPQNVPLVRFISLGHLRGSVHPKLTPPHLRTVTMTTRALSKKAGVGARERNVCKRVCRKEKSFP